MPTDPTTDRWKPSADWLLASATTLDMIKNMRNLQCLLRNGSFTYLEYRDSSAGEARVLWELSEFFGGTPFEEEVEDNLWLSEFGTSNSSVDFTKTRLRLETYSPEVCEVLKWYLIVTIGQEFVRHFLNEVSADSLKQPSDGPLAKEHIYLIGTLDYFQNYPDRTSQIVVQAMQSTFACPSTEGAWQACERASVARQRICAFVSSVTGQDITNAFEGICVLTKHNIRKGATPLTPSFGRLGQEKDDQFPQLDALESELKEVQIPGMCSEYRRCIENYAPRRPLPYGDLETQEQAWERRFEEDFSDAYQTKSGPLWDVISRTCEDPFDRLSHDVQCFYRAGKDLYSTLSEPSNFF